MINKMYDIECKGCKYEYDDWTPERISNCVRRKRFNRIARNDYYTQIKNKT